MVKIVIIEDDKTWIDLLNEELSEKIEDSEISSIFINSNNYDETIRELINISPDLAIIDINMGGNSKAGIKLANRINKEISKLNYVFLSSQKSEDPLILKEASYTKAKAFLDKNDFKNDLDSLTNYIKNNVEIIKNNTNQLNIPPVLIDFDSRTVILNNNEIHFTRMEFEIFSYLAKNHNKFFTKYQLYRYASTDANVQEGTFENTVVSHIKAVRDKLKKVDKNFNPIKTVQSYGYKYDYKRES